MPLLKAFKAPEATVAIRTSKDQFVLGETIEGDLLVSSQEDFTVKEVRIELYGLETLKPVESMDEPIDEGETEGSTAADFEETAQTRLYSPEGWVTQNGDATEYTMHKGAAVVSGTLGIARGSAQPLPFRIDIPSNLGPTFRGLRKDGQWIGRAWKLRAVLAVGGRPDVKVEKGIQVLERGP